MERFAHIITVLNYLSNNSLQTPVEACLEGLLNGVSHHSLMICHISGKGRGVVASSPIRKGSYLCEHKTLTAPYKRNQKLAYETEYSGNEEGCYILEGQYMGTWYCFDATRCFHQYGRYLNHSSTPNCKPMPPLLVNGVLRVGFVATSDIKTGEKVTYNYNVAPQGQEWLKAKVCLS